MNGRILTVALACAATAFGVVALEGGRSEALGASSPRQLDIVLRQSEAHMTMVPGSQHPDGQQGQSPGDIVVMNGPVRDWDSGRVLGQVDATFIATRTGTADGDREQDTGIFSIGGDQISVLGVSETASPGSKTVGIIGGTGRFATARGTVTVSVTLDPVYGQLRRYRFNVR
jgi:hypothetical protein